MPYGCALSSTNQIERKYNAVHIHIVTDIRYKNAGSYVLITKVPDIQNGLSSMQRPKVCLNYDSVPTRTGTKE